MKKLGIDLSLRSTGIVLSDDKKIINCWLYQPTEKCYEQLLLDYREYFEKFFNLGHVFHCINIEDLSLNSKSSVKDVIAANYWNLRCYIHENHFHYKVFSPSNWRKVQEIIPKDRKQKDLKQELGKDYLKILAVKKLSSDNFETIAKFKEENKLPEKTIYDLADAYWISQM